MSGNELPKVLDKSQADIDAAIAAINASEIESSTKDFAISCIKLAVWLLNALLEHKIKLSNLRKLIFGLGRKNKKQPKDAEQSNAKDSDQHNDNANTSPVVSGENEAIATSNQITKSGHGRLPHSVYTNTIEHQLLTIEYQAGNPCPMLCGGKLYTIEPGVIVRVKGENLATVHKYWIEKLRCALCSPWSQQIFHHTSYFSIPMCDGISAEIRLPHKAQRNFYIQYLCTSARFCPLTRTMIPGLIE